MLRFGRVTVRFGKPMDFSRFEGLAGNRFIERAVIDEVIYELDGPFRPGIRRHLRRHRQGRQRVRIVSEAVVFSDPADGGRLADRRPDQLTAETGVGAVDARGAVAVAAATATAAPAVTMVASAHHR